MYKMSQKIVATMILAVMLLAQMSLIGIYGSEVIAAESSFETQSTKTNNQNVEFDAYFMEDKNKIHEASKKIDEESSIYLQVTANNGYLKDAKVKFVDEEDNNANFKLENVENSLVQEVNSASSTVSLNQINNDTKTIEIPIVFNYAEKILPSEFLKLTRAVFTATYVDASGKENKIQKEIKLALTWKTDLVEREEGNRILLEEKITEFRPFEVDEKEGVILQTTINTKVQDNVLPIKTTTIEITVPKINDIKPERVKVYATSTKATNGDETGYSFNEDNYTYNQDENKLTITVENVKDENGKIVWKKDSVDEYKVTYIYPKQVKELLENEEQEVSFKVSFGTKATINTYDAENIRASQTIRHEEILSGNIGRVTDFKLEKDTQSLSKGNIYANYVATEKQETTYKTNLIAEISVADITDKIVLEPGQDYLVASDGITLKPIAIEEEYYKQISTDKSMLNKILGEDIEVKIYNGEEVVYTINKEVVESTEEQVIVDLSKLNVTKLTIETSKPVEEGVLVFNVEKALKDTLGFTKAQMQDMKALNISLDGKTNLDNQSMQENIEFTEPETKAELVINKENLSTVVKNENVELKAILKTDSVDNNLFKNPTITITLPKEIEEVNVKDVKLLFDNDLTVTGATLGTNSNGQKTIVVNLTGEQTKYSIDSVTGGANIAITADLGLNKFTANKTENIVMTYTNENEATANRTKQTEASVNFIAPVGVVTVSNVEGYADNEKTIALNGEDKTLVAETMKPAREVKFDMSFINNYNNTIDSTVVLGRIPSKETGNNTFGMTLKDAIQVSGIDASRVTVYYSTKADATKEINTANGWTTSPTNYEDVKSYLIVVNGELNTSDSVNFAYTANLPANLDFNQTVNEKYTVYFNNNLATGKIEDSQVSANIEITTGKGPALEVEVTSNIPEDQVIYTDGTIKYTINVKNVGTKEANNVIVDFDIPKGTYIGEEVTNNNNIELVDNTKIKWKIDTLNVGENVSQEIEVKVGKIIPDDFCTNEEHFDEDRQHKDEYTHNFSEYELTTEAKATAISDELNMKTESNTVKNNLKRAIFSIESYRKDENWVILGNETDIDEETELKENFIVSSKIYGTNIDNTVFTTIVPKGLIYKSVEVEGKQVKSNYNKNNRVLTVELGTIDYNRNEITVTYESEKLNQNEYVKPIEIFATLSSGNISESSQAKQYRIVKEGLEIIQTANIPNGSIISAEEKITYKIDLKNIGSKYLIISLKDILPDSLFNNGGSYTIGEKTVNYSASGDNNINLTIHLSEGETAVIEVKAIVDAVTEDTKITNVVTASTDNTEVKSNEITYTIEKTKYADIDDNNDDDNKTALTRLGGVAWKDENKNGIKEADEELLSNIEVLLLNTNTNQLFTQNGNIVRERTNENGIYTFNNVPSGNYIVIFLYDTGKYSATTYKAENVDETLNSDARDSKIIIDGIITTVALTNTIELKESNIYNIDLGVVDNPKFDLKLDMDISKVTVQNAAGTNVYEYNNTNLAKVEFVEKYLEGTTIVVEYTIKVTNEGAVEGYVKKIADYLPKELSFSSELNRDWYENGNGTIYNASLANTLILPGETKEVKLLLTKTVNANSLGIINNSAEIYEAYNDLGLADIDSEVANNNTNEDDYASTDLVLSIKTGKMVTFIGLTFAIIAIIGTSAYIIKKKVLR